ncbi:hypothetical protein GQ44DRAFT_705197 [Phaeosphaeriaceae sp. PMI808]|nr:hypothetical protein GQ44DRAFT_705197 [Phaeosphaeriaceae sp. PMI808]
MGKPTPPIEPYRDDPDAVSLHTTPDEYTYDDAPEISGLPPSYAVSENESTTTLLAPIRHIPPPTTRTNHDNPEFRNGKPVVCETLDHIDPRLDEDPLLLEQVIRTYAESSPTPYIYIMGTHKETVKRGDKKEVEHITDFRIVINMKRYLHKDYHGHDTTSMALLTAENSEKTHRGTITKCRAPGVNQDIEVGTGKPSLAEWCHRYCASPRMLRIFRLQRTVPGFDTTYLKKRLEGVIATACYRGNVSITFPIEDENFDIYTSNFINRWRLKRWVCWIFYLTFLWIFTWPVLFFMTKRYAVVKAEWPFSIADGSGRKTYTTVSEEQWFSKWNVAVKRLVLDRYHGEVSEETMSNYIARSEDPPMPYSTVSTGLVGIDNPVGFLTQGVQIARAIQHGGNIVQGGWGNDS